MRRYLLLIWILLSAGVTGCATVTVADIKAKPAGVVKFQAQGDYQVVYRKIVTQARECYPDCCLSADLFVDTKKGNISYRAVAPSYHITLLHIEVMEAAPGETMVTCYFNSSPWRRRAKAVQAWIEQGFKGCQYPPLKAPPTGHQGKL